MDWGCRAGEGVGSGHTGLCRVMDTSEHQTGHWLHSSAPVLTAGASAVCALARLCYQNLRGSH